MSTDKYEALRTAVNDILGDDTTLLLADGSYEVRVPYPDGTGTFTVRVALTDRGEWTAFWPNGRKIVNAPHSARPHEVVAWALMS